MAPKQVVDIQAAYDNFYVTSLGLLEKFYPEQRITITCNEPSYITPNIKSALRLKNMLMRADRLEEAGAIAERISSDIVRLNTSEMHRC